MNEKFFDLPKEKQERIINAALKCLSQSGYKHTVTDDIAAQAGISKGLLFHYFENKKGLYEYLFGYSMRFIGERLRDMSVLEGDDFFDMIQNSTHSKTEIMREHPHLFAFVMNAYYDESAPAMDYIEDVYTKTLKNSTALILGQVNYSKFRDGVDVEQLINIVFWMADGLMLRQQRAGTMGDLDAIRALSDKAMGQLRQVFYKEEYL